MTSGELSLIRLRCQQVSSHDFRNSHELASWMGAMQAQDYNMARWAVGLRIAGSTHDSVQHAIDNGELIRTHVLRPTWHLVSAKDVGWMLDLTAAHIKPSLASRHKELGLTTAILRKATKTIAQALAGGALTRDELVEHLKSNKIVTRDQRFSHMLLWAELEKVICSGPLNAKKNTYALFEQRVPNGKTFTRDEALRELATRYFQSHGPATLQDFSNWSALPIADARKAIDFIRNSFDAETIDSKTYWFKNIGNAAADKNASAYLLPAFDEFIIGYKDRSAAVLAKNKSAVVGVNGIFWPVIVINGMVTGLWKRAVARNRVKVKFEFFRGAKPVDRDLIELLKGESQKVADFFRGQGEPASDQN
jgi:hypothetical protein